MAASSVAASKLLNLRNSALHNLICRHLLHPSAAASKNLLPFTCCNQSLNLFLLKIGGVKSHGHSSNACLPQWPLDSSLMQIGAVRTYVTKGDNNSDGVEAFDDEDDDADDDEFDDDDDIENYSGSDFDDEDEYEDPDEVPDSK